MFANLQKGTRPIKFNLFNKSVVRPDHKDQNYLANNTSKIIYGRTKQYQFCFLLLFFLSSVCVSCVQCYQYL